MKRIQLTLTAQEIPDQFAADISVVIDVLRASSVIITALAHGTPYIIPARSIEEAQALAHRFPEALLAGEREAIKIPGFDLGNSPLEHRDYPDRRPLILTTTNGTFTLSRVLLSHTILIGSFLNLQSLANLLINSNAEHIHLACAGTNGQFSLDDFLMAGGLVSQLTKNGYAVDDAGLAAEQLYEYNREQLSSALENCRHYQILLSKGFKNDLEFCLKENRYQEIGMVNKTHPAGLIIQRLIEDVRQSNLADYH